jgi:excisionase family DNA binding protein
VELISVSAACKLLGIGKTSMYGLVERRRVPFVRLPGCAKILFDPESLFSWDLHARNLVDGIDDKLVLTREVAQELNRLKPALYNLEGQPDGEQSR